MPIIEFRLIRTKGTDSLKIPYLLDYGTFKETGILKSGINQEDTFKVPVKSAIKPLRFNGMVDYKMGEVIKSHFEKELGR